ncbi:MAG: hypothetical protein MI755_17205 [Sphingomonadales bacterium]|nr:hypothetical protein [Sphingomonadales bacterium]
MPNSRIVLDFTFDHDSLPGYQVESDKTDVKWLRIFYGFVRFKIGSTDLSGYECILDFTSRMMESIDRILYFGDETTVYDYLEEKFYVKMKIEGHDIFFEGKQDRDELINCADYSASADTFEFCRMLGRLHISAVKHALHRYPQLKHQIDFITGCRYAKDLS